MLSHCDHLGLSIKGYRISFGDQLHSLTKCIRFILNGLCIKKGAIHMKLTAKLKALREGRSEAHLNSVCHAHERQVGGKKKGYIKHLERKQNQRRRSYLSVLFNRYNLRLAASRQLVPLQIRTSSDRGQTRCHRMHLHPPWYP